MATLSTLVVNAGYSNAGAPTVTKRGSATYFSVTNSVVPLAGVGPSTTAVKFFATTMRAGYDNEIPEVQPVDVKTNPYYLLGIVNSSAPNNESEVGTTPFYHKLANYSFTSGSSMVSVDPKTNTLANSLNSRTIIVVNEEQIFVINNTSFDTTLSTRQYLGQDPVTQSNILTTPFYSKIANFTYSEAEPIQVMNTTTFNTSLGTRDSKVITSVNEEQIFVLNVSDTNTNKNSPAITVTNPKPVLAVDQNTNSGRINTTAIQPKGTEAGNIGFAQAFGNTTITGKWF